MHYRYLTPDNTEIELCQSVNLCQCVCQSVKDLGVIMSTSLEFKDHINTIKSKVKQLTGWVLRTFYSRDSDLMLILWKQIILPHLDYCNILWFPRSVSGMQILESLQRSFTFRIAGLQHLNYWERLQQLRLYSVERRVERYFIIYIWKEIEASTEYDTTDFNTRTGRKIIIDRSEEVLSPFRRMKVLFNCLPKNIRNLTAITTDTFKNHLDRLLQRIPDDPNIPGYRKYMAAASNSIVDQIQYQDSHMPQSRSYPHSRNSPTNWGGERRNETSGGENIATVP